jgi:hypothetical protein
MLDRLFDGEKEGHWRGPHKFLAQQADSSLSEVWIVGQVTITYHWNSSKLEIKGTYQAKNLEGEVYKGKRVSIIPSGSKLPVVDPDKGGKKRPEPSSSAASAVVPSPSAAEGMTQLAAMC